MKTIEFDYTAGLTDITVALITTSSVAATTAAATESVQNPGTYTASFSDAVTGAKSVVLKRGTRVVAGNLFVEMPVAGGTARLSARASAPSPLVMPTLSTVNLEPLPARKLIGYTGGGLQHKVTVLDSNRNPINLSGKTLQAVLMDAAGVMIGDPITPTLEGASSNVIVFVAPAAWHATEGQYLYAVWDLDDVTVDGPRPWARGCYAVELTARPVTA